MSIFPQTLIAKAAATIAAVTIVFAFGAFVGYRYENSRNAKSRLAQAELIAHQSQVAFDQSAATSLSIDRKTEAVAANAKVITKLVVQRIKENNESTSDHSAACLLDRGTVSLLNAARANVPADAASVSNEESGTTSGIGIADFAENDIEVTRKYHELATRHDALVDYVQSKIDEQRSK